MEMARPERFERPTAWFVARYSIQLSYGRLGGGIIQTCVDFPNSFNRRILMTLTLTTVAQGYPGT